MKFINHLVLFVLLVLLASPVVAQTPAEPSPDQTLVEEDNSGAIDTNIDKILEPVTEPEKVVDVPQTLSATLILDKKQTGEKTDREIAVVAIPSDGFIQGTDGNEKKYILFSDIEEITWDLNTHSHTVKTWDGKTHTLKWGLIKSENTATAVTFQAKDATGKIVSDSVSPAEIKRLAFPKR